MKMTERVQIGNIYIPDGEHRPSAEDLGLLMEIAESPDFLLTYPNHTVVVFGTTVMGVIPKATLDTSLVVFDAIAERDRLVKTLGANGIRPEECILIETGE
ncbi:hypothetical protein A3B52_03765 [Candidatus Curtissbacteria bacterium RIFCSPLOWO2_01_FULL_41_28]|uniref:Uncharacterized protein n=1 Tax=Candidatus Curtissbacteria bacterium RIFOXYA1_FULL_41_14 TaxID=1797737 RepID=A0A1F5HE90_9BACT|nr:MAG: hypothetical protein A2683_01945 [Candidatus Curtissbacteria bacterium RIFCSPHIGHO2_01_FULL_34_40]OGD92490.1 MAG: hypothetical protein A3E14_04190 [Candidatus Curtissbacteria bacterium RIFCSPHIGHO2_12_FULL_41_13]OGD95168.1 MAG: hypothetical protein A3B52_03765 [Candidatus Curtissbacteria bacterium RIFCSPLOWO2_01_FULL_41_28]OGE02473.1 MAG: hypothetical protein A2196_01435 [Candidatus Curtissbacteria bacterium RIFOXYA1_FULL_41_14]OGE04438.1 MAG: hypothetical protein A2362_02435 [Candidatu